MREINEKNVSRIALFCYGFLLVNILYRVVIVMTDLGCHIPDDYTL